MEKQHRRKQMSVTGILWLTLFIMLSTIGGGKHVFAYTTEESFKVAPSVTYEEQESHTDGDYSTRVMEIDVSDPYTTVQLGLPEPIPKKMSVPDQAKMMSMPGNRVLGGVNGSFFYVASGYPSYLVALDRQLKRLGVVSLEEDDYMHTPAGFGIDSNGNAMLEKYSMDIQFTSSAGTIQADGYNRTRNSREVILYTSAFYYDTPRTNGYGIDIVVGNTDKSIEDGETKLGEEINGEIIAIREYGDPTPPDIPEDGFVMSFQGLASQQIENVKVGESVQLKVDLAGKWQDSKYIMASGPLLVQNGQVNITMDTSGYRAAMPHPRTAVGINSDGSKVYFVTVDGRQPGYSDGMTLPEFARYLQDLGVYQAINLDGGGSTTMVARKPGNYLPTLMNSPSDRYARPVVTSLMAVSQAPEGNAAIIKAHKAEQGKIVKGSSVALKIDHVLDTYYHPMDVEMSDLQVTVEGGVGRVEGNRFIAEQAGQGRIVLTLDNAREEIPVEVVRQPDRIEIQPNPLRMAEGSTEAFTVEASSTDGSSLIFDKNTIDWSTTGTIGSISSNGVLQAGQTSASGTVAATLNGQSWTIPVEVGGAPDLLSDFNSTSGWEAAAIRSTGSVRQAVGIEPSGTNGTLRLDYNFNTGDTGTAATYLKRTNRIQLDGRPDKLGVWVYGDGGDHWLRGNVYDANGTKHSLDFTEPGELNFSGWKYVTAELPEDAPLPLTFDQVYVVETDEAKKDAGVLFFDELKAYYDGRGPEALEDQISADLYPASKEFTITFNTWISSSVLDEESIYVVDKNGNKVETDISFGATRREVQIKGANGFKSDEFYKLMVTDGVISTGGKNLVDEKSKVFQIQ